MALWSGRFAADPAAEMVAFSESISVDLEMWAEDLEGSRAHAQMLARVGLLTDSERLTIEEGLTAIGAELASGAWRPGPEDEDIHMAVESRLIAAIGAPGAKLHTARSRNDQVATDVRLWLVRRLRLLADEIAGLVGTLVEVAARDGDILMPGYTHLQRGQPILLGHQLLAYAWMFRRDHGRVRDAVRRMDECPLGAGALAGTPHPIDRAWTATALGFSGPVPNAMDAVASRDHALEAATCCAILATHLSRLSEDLVVWSSEEFAFVRISEGYATGSSIMPQKRNPDAPELVRGRSARVIGDAVTLLALVKGLPMAYNRDLQEDRRALFDAVGTARACTRILAGTLSAARFAKDRFETELRGSFVLATEIADWLVTRGVPFRDGHHAAGRVVAWCEANRVNLDGVPPAQWAAFHPQLDASVAEWLDPRAAVGRRASLGGTAPSEVEAQIQALRRWLAAEVA